MGISVESTEWLFSPLFPGRIGIWKITVPGEKPSEQGREPTTNSTHRDGAVAEHLSPMQASHQCGPGSIPGLGVKCGLSLLLVLVLAPRGFSPGTPVFPSPQKPTFPNSN